MSGGGSDLFEGVRELIRERLTETCLPSLAVAVSRGEAVLWEEAFGWADREARVAATPHTLYSLASISKPITATGVMVLAARDGLDPDRPANDYLGEAKLTARVGDASEATLRRVADHTSGLPLHWNFFPEDEPRRRPSMDETIRRYGHLVTAPGERYQYSNLGYGVLDYVIARLSGKPFAQFMRQEVFLPLGMTRASVDLHPGLEPYAATRYDRDGLRLPFYDFDHPGGSAVYASAHDLLRFGMFHLGLKLRDQKQILPDSLREEMQAPTATADGGAGYAFGWRIATEYGGRRTVAHSGGMDGVNTTLVLVPSEGIAVVALANAAGPLPFDIAREVLKQLLGAPQKPEETGKAEAEEARPFPCPPEWAGEWQGAVHTYEGERPLTLRFQPDGDIHARLGEQLWTLVNEPRFAEGWLTGQMNGDLATADANRLPYCLHLDLKLRGDRLTGAVIVRSPPTTRLDSALSHWTELRRAGWQEKL